MIDKQMSSNTHHSRLGSASLDEIRVSRSPTFTLSQSAKKRKTLDDSVSAIASSLNDGDDSKGNNSLMETLLLMEQSRMDCADAENRRADRRAEEREEARAERDARSDRQMMMMMMTGQKNPAMMKEME
jgi:hypothetical protein